MYCYICFRYLMLFLLLWFDFVYMVQFSDVVLTYVKLVMHEQMYKGRCMLYQINFQWALVTLWLDTFCDCNQTVDNYSEDVSCL